MSASGYSPYLPPINPYVMPFGPFDKLLGNYGTRLTWQKSHLCPCTFSGQLTGSPDPQCNTCHGLGWYWDTASPTFSGLITFVHMSPSPDEPGVMMDEKFGQIQHAEPTLTIPQAAGAVWQEASLNDVFVQIDAIDRFESQLQVGGIQVVPYQQLLTVPVSGAVTVYNTATNAVDLVSGYVVSGAAVTLPSGYATGTSYVVQYKAAKAFVAWRPAGAMAHDRPYGEQPLPKRFRLQALDLWLRGSGKI
jgi:hypothetical protein